MTLKKKARRLRNVGVDEVSLVDNPANMRKFLLFKRQGNTAGVTSQADGELVNKQFNELPEMEQVSFLEALRALDESIEKKLSGDDDEAVQFNYEFGAMSQSQKKEFVARLRKIIERVQEIESAGFTPLQKAALLDTYKTELGLIRLYLRDPGLYHELSKDADEGRQGDWSFDYDQSGIPVISKRLKRTFGPGENATHKFEERNGKWAWYPKKKRDLTTGRYN